MTAVADDIQLDEAAFRGHVVRPGTPEYDVHRKIWNGSFDKHPAVIVRCAGVSDVIAAVKFGRASGLPVAVRSGGHSFPGLSVADDALMIDLSPMKGVRVDPEQRTARVQAGVLLGELDRETQAFGLAVPSGIVTHTGVAGLTLGGGIGWIMRKHGLSVDQLVSMDLVTADGEFVKASADENADLFWGLRGGGGNFGIVTEFEFRCVPLGTQVLAGPIFWPMEQSGEVLRFYRDWVADAPDELMTIVVHRKAPPLPVRPGRAARQAGRDGRPAAGSATWRRGRSSSSRCASSARRSRTSACRSRTWRTRRCSTRASCHGRWYYFKSCDVAELNDEIIDITVERSLQIESPLTSFPIWQMGGAVSRVGDDDTAFNGRTAAFTYNIGACTETGEGFDEEREWVRSFWSALEPWHQGVYVNFLGDEGADRVRQAYGPEKYDRLRALEAEVRPGQLLPDQPEHLAELSEGPRGRGPSLDARYGETRRTLSETRVTVSNRIELAPALSEPISSFAGHAFSRWYRATGVPVASYITSDALFRAADQSFIASSCHAANSRSLVIPRLRVTVGGGRLPGTASLRPSDSMKSMS